MKFKAPQLTQTQVVYTVLLGWRETL